MSNNQSFETAKRIFKDKCPRCTGELKFLSSTKNSSDYVVICMKSSCGFYILKEGLGNYFSSG